MGKSTKALLFCGALLILLVGARILIAVVNPPDDKTLIQTALKESIKASKEGKPGGVLDLLSAHISYNGSDEGGNKGEMAEKIRQMKPDVTVENMDPDIKGDEATIESPVDLSVNFLGQSVERHIKNAKLVFRKEDDHSWLVIPTRKWKLADVEVTDGSAADLFQQ